MPRPHTTVEDSVPLVNALTFVVSGLKPHDAKPPLIIPGGFARCNPVFSKYHAQMVLAEAHSHASRNPCLVVRKARHGEVTVGACCVATVFSRQPLNLGTWKRLVVRHVGEIDVGCFARGFRWLRPTRLNCRVTGELKRSWRLPSMECASSDLRSVGISFPKEVLRRLLVVMSR